MRTSRSNLVNMIWNLVLVLSLLGVVLFFSLEAISYSIPFEKARGFVDSLAADGYVQSLTFNGYQLTKSFSWVAGLLVLEFLMFWIVARRKILSRLNDILTPKKAIQSESLEQASIPTKIEIRSSPLIASFLFILFYPLYLAIGLFLRHGALFLREDILFDIDTPVAVQLLTGSLNTGERHPLFKLFFLPLGVIATKVTQSEAIASIAVNALFGALCIVLMFLLLSKAGINAGAAFLWSAIFGVSTTHLMFSSLPETYIFSTFSLILLFYLVATYPANLTLFIPAAVFSVGITTSNIIPAIITFAFSMKAKVQLSTNRTTLFITFLLAVIIISVLLNVFSIVVFKSGVPSFLPWFYLDQQLSWTTLQHPTLLSERLFSLVESFFLYNFIAPKLYLPLLHLDFDPSKPNLMHPNYLEMVRDTQSAASFTSSSFATYSGVGLISAQIWLGLLIFAIFNFIRFPENRSPLVLSLLVTLVFNFLLHIFFGLDIFLYSAHWTFAILAFIAIMLRRYGNDTFFQFLLGLILFLFAMNNLMLITDVKLIFG